MRPKKKFDKEHPYIQARKNKLYKRLSTEEAIKLIKEQSILDSNNVIKNKAKVKIEANCPTVKTSDKPPAQAPIKPKKNKPKTSLKKKKTSNKNLASKEKG